jgi:hypothetical protein
MSTAGAQVQDRASARVIRAGVLQLEAGEDGSGRDRRMNPGADGFDFVRAIDMSLVASGGRLISVMILLAFRHCHLFRSPVFRLPLNASSTAACSAVKKKADTMSISSFLSRDPSADSSYRDCAEQRTQTDSLRYLARRRSNNIFSVHHRGRFVKRYASFIF